MGPARAVRVRNGVGGAASAWAGYARAGVLRARAGYVRKGRQVCTRGPYTGWKGSRFVGHTWALSGRGLGRGGGASASAGKRWLRQERIVGEEWKLARGSGT